MGAAGDADVRRAGWRHGPRAPRWGLSCGLFQPQRASLQLRAQAFG